MEFGFKLNVDAIRVVVPNAGVKTVPEDQYFRQRDTGGVAEGVYPLPANVDAWSVGEWQGEQMLVARSGKDFYVIGEDRKFGLCLHHYVYDPEHGGGYRQSWNLPRRSLQNERRNTSMEIGTDLRSAVGRMGGQRVTSMNLSNGGPMEAVSIEDGISGEQLVRKIGQDARGRGYVAGYIMGSAPAVTMVLSRTRHKDADDTYGIIAKESKPARMLGVALCLPRRCVTRGGQMASPNEIMNGQVDFNSVDPNEMVRQVFTGPAAIAYIYALGREIPEYAPHVTNAAKQWPVDAILSRAPEVSFVRVNATEKKNATSAQDRFNFSLKTTSPRRSLYTQRNVVCLRANEHINVKCSTDADAYMVNESAFRAWAFRVPSNETRDTLTRAIAECPGQIWRKEYTIDGKTVSGIGSAFFMSSNEDTNENGEKVMKVTPTYFPWFATGDQRPTQGTSVTRIVKRVHQVVEGKKERMTTVPVKWSENPGHPMLQAYKAFATFLISEKYLREDELASMGGRTSRAKAKTYEFTPDQDQGLRDYMMSDAVRRDIQAVQDADASRSIIADAAARARR